MRHARFALLAFLLLALSPLAAQQPAPATPSQARPTFSASTRLVVQAVTVKDKQGRMVEGLTAADFTVTEDGDPQDVAFVEFHQLPAPLANASDFAAAPSSPVGTATPRPTATATVAPTTNATVATFTPGDPRYRNRRLLVLYFDLTSLPSEDLLRAYNGARKYVSTEMTAADLIGIMVFDGGGVRVRQDFTSSKEQLLGGLEALVFGQGTDANGLPNTLQEGTAFGQDDGEFAILNTNRQLSALQTAIEMLRPLPDQKSLLYFASGVRLSGLDNQAQLRATVNAALRANVLLFPVDARGLVASAPVSDATRASSGGIGIFSGQSVGAATTGFHRSQDTLFALGKDTGGKAMLNFNDLSAGIVEAASAQTSYYILAYYSTHTDPNGKLRRVKIGLTGERDLELAYRNSYYADKVFAKLNDVEKERQLEEALMLENPVTELPLALEVNYFQLNRAEYFIPVTVKIPGSELALAQRGGAAHTLIDFIGEVKDEFGHTVQNVRDKVDVKLSGESAAQLAKRPIAYDTGFTVLPGQYTLKVLARDAETGHVGTFLTTFIVPNLDREATRLPISSVVLSSQRVALGDEVVNLQKADAQAANPLVFDGQKLIPSVTRVFSRTRPLFVFLQAYERSATATEPVVAFVTIFNGNVKVIETSPVVVTDPLQPRSKALSVKLSVPLDELATGRYDVQVTVVNPSGQKANFWRAPIAIVP